MPVEGDLCSANDSVFFAQYSCLQSEQSLGAKRFQALYCVCMDIFLTLCFLTLIAYLRDLTYIMVKEWDIKTITVTDYSVEWEIPEEVFERFESENPNEPSSVYSFLNKMI